MSDESSYWSRAMRRRFSRRTVLRSGAAGAGVIGLIAAGCGSSTKNNSNSSNANTSSAATSAAAKPSAAASSAAAVASAAPSAAAAAAPSGLPQADSSIKTGGTINLNVVVANIPLDPIENTTYTAQHRAGAAYSRLFRFLSGPDVKTTLSRTPVGDLVESVENSDPTTYTMKLRQGVMFHPPLSRALTSADILASYKRFTTDAKNTNSGVYAPIVDSLTAPDDNTIVFKLKQPYGPFLNKLANPQYLWIMSADAVNGKIDPAKQVVGTGPWIPDTDTPTAFSFKKNPNYFIKGIPYADALVFNVIPTTATQEAQFQAGKLDLLGAAAADVEVIQKATPKATLVTYSPNGFAGLFFSNIMDPNSPFSDVRMRRAASLAIDRDGLVQAIYNGKGVWDNLINPGLGKWFLDPKGPDIGSAGQWFKHDPAQAKSLLTAAGHADTTFKFIYPNNAYGDTYNSQSDAIRGMLADAGFKLQVVTVDYLKDYINNGQGIFNKGAPPNSIVHFLETPFTDPDDFLTGFLTPGGNRNHDLMDVPALTALVKQEQQELDDNKRLPLVYQITKMADDQMYYPPATYTNAFDFAQPWAKNFFVADDYNDATESFAYLSVNNKG